MTLFTTGEGNTPLTPDEQADLIPNLATKEELNQWERENILVAYSWALHPRTLTRENPLSALLAKDRHLERLLKVADSEPPRVRALLGALAEELERDPAARARLRASLNPLSRFDFGQFTALTHAREWQAKERPKT